MKLHENQAFLSLYYEPNAVEIATGEANGGELNQLWEQDRKLLGQVETPAVIAELMAKWVMSAKPRKVLDPAAGMGGLLRACHNVNRQAILVGVERDESTLRLAKRAAPRGAKLILADYLKSDAGLFDGIIANPPYVKAHRLSYSEEDWKYFEERLGTPLRRLTNLYALFLLKIWEDLAPHGRAAVIIPAEFLNANFGVEIKERLARVVRPAGLAVFLPAVGIFENALTTSAIVFMEKGRAPGEPSPMMRVESVDEAASFVDSLLLKHCPSRAGCTDLAALNPEEKWLNSLLNGPPGDPGLLPRRVGNFFDCRRGIATGANDFFCLSQAEMAVHKLTANHVEPCITKAMDADGLVFTAAKFQALVGNERRCFLLNPSQNGSALANYLKLGEHCGIPQRHLPSHRPVWYLPENRDAADILVAVFSRESAKFILNTSRAKNLTCFHGLFAKSEWKASAPLMTVFLNSSAGRFAFSRVNRFYGGGLNKLEPKDVEEMGCPEMPRLGRTDVDELARKLVELEKLCLAERTARIDDLVKYYFNINLRLGACRTYDVSR